MLGGRGVEFHGVRPRGIAHVPRRPRQGGARITETWSPSGVDAATREELARSSWLRPDSALPSCPAGAPGSTTARTGDGHGPPRACDAWDQRGLREGGERDLLVKRIARGEGCRESSDGAPAAPGWRGPRGGGVGSVVSRGAAARWPGGRAGSARLVSVPRRSTRRLGRWPPRGLDVGLVRGGQFEACASAWPAAANTLSLETGGLRPEDVEALRPRVSVAALG